MHRYDGGAPPGYPQTPIPQATRAAVRRRACGLCEQCGARLPLDLHHLRRWVDDVDGAPRAEPIAGHETPSDLLALCRECHYGNHRDLNGEYWWDMEEKDEHWSTYLQRR